MFTILYAYLKISSEMFNDNLAPHKVIIVGCIFKQILTIKSADQINIIKFTIRVKPDGFICENAHLADI